MCTCAYRGRWASRLMCTYALTDNYSFLVFVLSCLVLTFIKKDVFLHIFESQAIDFLEKSSYTNVCLKFLCDAKLIMPLLIL